MLGCAQHFTRVMLAFGSAASDRRAGSSTVPAQAASDFSIVLRSIMAWPFRVWERRVQRVKRHFAWERRVQRQRYNTEKRRNGDEPRRPINFFSVLPPFLRSSVLLRSLRILRYLGAPRRPSDFSSSVISACARRNASSERRAVSAARSAAACAASAASPADRACSAAATAWSTNSSAWESEADAC